MNKAFLPFSFDRVVRAVALVRQRLLTTTGALKAAHIPYAVIGANAVAAWVATIDEAAVRNTPNVDVLIGRNDLSVVWQAMEAAGFSNNRLESPDVFLDASTTRAREGVRFWYECEKVKPDDLLPNSKIGESQIVGDFTVIGLAQLVQMKLVAFRDVDRTHLRDMIEVGLIDQASASKLPPELAARLWQLLDTPGG